MTLILKSITKHFGGIKALQGASLAIEPNTITAIIGPNGSGKTTLFNAISKLITLDKGRIILNTKDVTDKKDYEVAKAGIARTFQEVRLFPNLTIQDHLEIALRTQDESLLVSFFAKVISKKEKAQRILDLVGLNKHLNTLATDLSYGQRKLLDLAVAIAKPHHILMLDEPVAGINPKLREEIKKILRTLKAKGETIFLIEHDMNFVMDLVDYIYVIDEGKIIAEGLPKEIQNNPKVLEAYLGD